MKFTSHITTETTKTSTMKLKITLLLLLSCLYINAQQLKGIIGEDNWLNNWTNFKPASTEYNEATTILTGVISSNMTLQRKNTYRLIGVVYVTNKATLTIEPGTVIRGDKETCGTLVITKGSKIMAEGNETAPIVFTSNNAVLSRKPGDWGGIVILGDAPINRIGGIGFLDFNLNTEVSYYGGANEEDNSGILKFVRIEFSGRKLKEQKELNGLSLAGVGNKTKLENIQISFSNDDSFECYGGKTTLNNIISYRSTDDDFDFTQGAQAKITNSIAIRDPFSSDVAGSRCFEIDNYDKIENCDFTKKATSITANNMTLLNTQENNQGLVKESIYIKDKCFLTLDNSVIHGFSAIAVLDSKISYISENLGRISFRGVIANNCSDKIISEVAGNNIEIANWYSNASYALDYTTIPTLDFFIQPSLKKAPDFRLKSYTNLASK
jgi:hypothetical protein